MSPEERFERFVLPEPNSGCFLWIGQIDKYGYGRFWVDKISRSGSAHRHAWKMVHGPVPAGRHVLHRCDNPACVNPDHLFIGDQKTNVSDCIRKDRHNRGERHGHARLTVEDIYAIRSDDRQYQEIMNDYGINSAGHISSIKSRKRWKYLP